MNKRKQKKEDKKRIKKAIIKSFGEVLSEEGYFYRIKKTSKTISYTYN